MLINYFLVVQMLNMQRFYSKIRATLMFSFLVTSFLGFIQKVKGQNVLRKRELRGALLLWNILDRSMSHGDGIRERIS